ncbi:hypothetical protein F5B20DRAFT_58965 [Whalleya microplaca]|nr:hypothetical protein F5B20DRAFT_58965 [Whalleya microplaca]
MDTDPSPQTPQLPGSPKQQAAGPDDRGDEVMKDASPIPNDTPEDLEQTKIEADRFLEALGIELLEEFSADPSLGSGVTMDANDNAIISDNQMSVDEATSGDHDGEFFAEGSRKYYLGPDGNLYQPVLAPQFSPNVVRMFSNRVNPVIHTKANRKTAGQMWKPFLEKKNLEGSSVTQNYSSDDSQRDAPHGAVEGVPDSGSEEARPLGSGLAARVPDDEINLRRLSLCVRSLRE